MRLDGTNSLPKSFRQAIISKGNERVRKVTEIFAKCDRLMIISKNDKILKIDYPIKIVFGNENIDGTIEFFEEHQGQVYLKITEREPE